MTSERLPQPHYSPPDPPPFENARATERIVLIEPSAKPRTVIDHLLRATVVMGLLLVITLLAGLLFTVLSVVGIGHHLSGSLNDVSRAVGNVDTQIGNVAQGIADHFNPAHPPRNALSYDAEFDDLRLVSTGAELGHTGDYVYTLSGVKKRSAGDPNTTQYAVIHRAYIKPHETKVFGQTISEDKGEQDYYVYKGESFSIGRSSYKVNWLSVDQNQAAIARYRNADTLSTSLKFQASRGRRCAPCQLYPALDRTGDSVYLWPEYLNQYGGVQLHHPRRNP